MTLTAYPSGYLDNPTDLYVLNISAEVKSVLWFSVVIRDLYDHEVVSLQLFTRLP